MDRGEHGAAVEGVMGMQAWRSGRHDAVRCERRRAADALLSPPLFSGKEAVGGTGETKTDRSITKRKGRNSKSGKSGAGASAGASHSGEKKTLARNWILVALARARS